eukprot:1159930-Pelagomonas_calceolata.AAC.3
MAATILISLYGRPFYNASPHPWPYAFFQPADALEPNHTFFVVRCLMLSLIAAQHARLYGIPYLCCTSPIKAMKDLVEIFLGLSLQIHCPSTWHASSRDGVKKMCPTNA